MADAPARVFAWKTAFHYLRTRRLDGTWEEMNQAMRRRLRKQLGRDPEPSAGIVDSPSAKNTGVGGEQRGFDGGKKVLRLWAKEWFEEGRNIDLDKLFPRRRGFEVLPRRWVAERSFAWISHNRRTGKEHERLCSTGEAFVYAPMTRLMARRSARRP